MSSFLFHLRMKIASYQTVKALPQSFKLIDVRTREECSKGVIPNAVNIPLDELRNHLPDLKNRNVIFYCLRGGRAASATEMALKEGVLAQCYSGSYLDWMEQSKN